MTCKYNLTTGAPIMVKDSCPGRNAIGGDICHLDGCADHIKNYLDGSSLYFIIGILFVAYFVIYLVSTYFTTQLTYHYIRDAIKDAKEGLIDESDGLRGEPVKTSRPKFKTLAKLATHDRQKLTAAKKTVQKKVSRKPKQEQPVEHESEQLFIKYDQKPPKMDLTESQVGTEPSFERWRFTSRYNQSSPTFI